MKKAAIWLLVWMVAFCVLFPQGAQAESSKYVVTASSLYIRQSPSGNGKILTQASKGAVVSVGGSVGSWYKVSYNGVKGYAAKAYLKKQDSANGSGGSRSYATLQSGSSGSDVRSLQRRLKALGYSVEETGYYNTATVNAVKHFQMQCGYAMNGVASAAVQRKLFSSSAPRYKGIVKMDFFTSGVQSLFPRGGTAYIIDCATGTKIRIYRVQGSNHFDVEPYSKADTAKLKRISGGSWSWNSRPVILVVGGKYIAAAINTMPHGTQHSTTNGFEGHFCLHTTNSKTHGTNKINESHQSSISKAAKWIK